MPSHAGAFYESDSKKCFSEALELVESASLPENIPGKLFGGLVPHAGWSFSGSIAAVTFQALLGGDREVGTMIIFGADHTGSVDIGEVYDSGAWETPVRTMVIDQELASGLIDSSELLRANPSAHSMEHSIEVQLPLLAAINPELKIVPIAMPLRQLSVEAGLAVGELLRNSDRSDVLIAGSSDLTHHGGHFGNPGGHGPDSEKYAAQNDRRIINLIEQLRAEEIIPEVRERNNACGAGAIAATISAVRAMGATSGTLLAYTNSYRLTHERFPQERDDTTVGYASVIFS